MSVLECRIKMQPAARFDLTQLRCILMLEGNRQPNPFVGATRNTHIRWGGTGESGSRFPKARLAKTFREENS
jgi:hypothetical protein